MDEVNSYHEPSGEVSRQIRVICHDNRNLVTGRIVQVSQTGCLLASHEGGVTPVFPRSAQVLLNLHDERSGKSQNLEARLTGVSRREGGWTYRIRWGNLRPSLL